MGRKGVSKRKPKKSRPFSNADISGSSNIRSGQHSQVQALVNDKGAPPNKGGMNPSAGSNKNRNNKGS